ncbi:phosphopantetheine adenylyltransferase [Archaeoglobus profundus]|uniref:Phosphopantetheine adenylyltransferase n=1 Tax=Archaeoglobus profundus (strain DSM 5631 / JCM 9629 / NBRC 100127 / Av18) TaxID=572546 RepID=D2RF89_ARCPA|nr:phosphopantetheine adenylyltransferase [Archaeoglobus profundus]ADB58783.1 cytidyltransferase-related domain protein [Archaeoglobus profundus DSM 5631]
MKVALGGTFDPLHEGHKRLIRKAFSISKDVVFGVTSDEMARKRLRNVLPYNVRVRNLKEYVKRSYGVEPRIEIIKDCYGKTLEEDYDYLIVSPETYENAKRINKKRIEIGKRPITIVVVDFVLAYDKKPISATRIKNGEIDRFGFNLKPRRS